MTTIIFVFFIAFLPSLLLTPIVIRVAKRYNILDIPKERWLPSLEQFPAFFKWILC